MLHFHPKRHFLSLFTILMVCFTFNTIGANAVPSSHHALAIKSKLTRASTDQTIAPMCFNPPRDNCSFYSDCVESRYQCGANGYPIGYGLKFCQKYSEERDLLDATGVKWMLDVMQCLQGVLVPEATGAADAVQTCDELQTKAFASHVKCYVDNGFCTLGPKDWAAIVQIIGLKTILLDKNSLLTELETGVSCLEAYTFFLAELV